MRLPANNWKLRGTEYRFYEKIVTDITTRNSYHPYFEFHTSV